MSASASVPTTAPDSRRRTIRALLTGVDIGCRKLAWSPPRPFTKASAYPVATSTAQEARMNTATIDEVRAELTALEDPRVLAVNQKHGDDHAVNLTKLRGIAKRLKTRPELAAELWASGDTAARLLSLLICRPKAVGRDELDAMMRDARTPKVRDWLLTNVVKKSAHAEDLRQEWFADPDAVVASAGWALTTDAVAKHPDRLDLPGLLDDIESRMPQAPDPLQWAMNHCLAQIGIEHPELRPRALAIGERLEVLKDYPTPPNCTSPFAPTWITEMVHRRENA